MTFASTRVQNSLWAAGALVLVAVVFSVVYVRSRPSAAVRIALKSQRLEQVHAVRIALAAVSEAQNSAVMSSTDDDTQYFVAQARSAASRLDHQLDELESSLVAHGSFEQLDLLNRTKQALVEFDRLDKKLLDLAVQSSNRKAFALAFGPATDLLRDLEAALARITASRETVVAEDEAKVLRLAYEARVGVLRIQTLLFPHIAEASDSEMDRLESQIAQQEHQVAQNLDSLSTLLQPSDAANLAKARALYEDFGKLRSKIITLSRENTNMRSLSIALNEKRKAMLDVEDSLAALERAIEAEEVVPELPQRL